MYYIENKENNMISSRQIVELIKREADKESRVEVVNAYKKIIDRIEVLEDIDMAQSVKNWNTSSDNDAKKQARKEFSKLFKD